VVSPPCQHLGWDGWPAQSRDHPANSSNQTPAEIIYCPHTKPSAPHHPPQFRLEANPSWTFGPLHRVVHHSPGPCSTSPWLPSRDDDALQVIWAKIRASYSYYPNYYQHLSHTLFQNSESPHRNNRASINIKSSQAHGSRIRPSFPSSKTAACRAMLLTQINKYSIARRDPCHASNRSYSCSGDRYVSGSEKRSRGGKTFQGDLEEVKFSTFPSRNASKNPKQEFPITSAPETAPRS